MNQKTGRRKQRLELAKRGGPFQDLVGDVAKAFHPKSSLTVGQWVQGPDGRRELDVSIRGQAEGRPVFILIECKDYTYAKHPTPVGIGDVDALESKRRDVRADFTFIASNSGFTGPALRKAARTSIGAIAVIKEGDQRAKTKILHGLFLRRLYLDGDTQVHYLFEGDTPPSALNFEGGVATIEGEHIDDWLMSRAVLFAASHPWEQRRIRAGFAFREPTRAAYKGEAWLLKQIGISFTWRTMWFRQTVELDAGAAVFDYMVARLFLAPGKNKIIFRDINWDTAEPCDPPTPDEYNVRRQGEFVIQLCLFHNVARGDFPKDSAISRRVTPGDMAAVWGEIKEPETDVHIRRG